jgi:hypothetical protein
MFGQLFVPLPKPANKEEFRLFTFANWSKPHYCVFLLLQNQVFAPKMPRKRLLSFELDKRNIT